MAELATLEPETDLPTGELLRSLDKQVTARSDDHLVIEVRGALAVIDPGRPGPTVELKPGRHRPPDKINGEATAGRIVRWLANEALLGDDDHNPDDWVTVVECIDNPINGRRTYRAAVCRQNGPDGLGAGE